MRWLKILAILVAMALAVGAGAAAGGAAAAAATPTVSVTTNAQLGPILVGPNGMTLYLYKKDAAGVSNCTGGCAAAWPPLTVTGAPTAGAGVTGTLGTITRADGTTQVTYNGWPLYYYAADSQAGQTSGQGVGGVWSVVSPTAAAAPTAAANSGTSAGASSSPAAATSSTTASSSASATAAAGAAAGGAAGATLSVAQNAQLGPILVGPNGMTLYYFKKDSNGVSNCSGTCATLWPPLTVTGAATAGAGVTGTIGTIKRADGSTQVTYNGWPLYYFSSDTKAGDTTGQGVKSVWYVVPPTLATAPTAAAAPALPKTGGGTLPEAAGALLAAAGAALLIGRRRRAA
jgi:LPXTG-motif cell wall-anchored protein